MLDAIAALSIVAIEFTALAVVGCLLARVLGADEIAEEITRAHRRGHVHELGRDRQRYAVLKRLSLPQYYHKLGGNANWQSM